MDFAYRLSMIAEDDPYPAYRWMRDHDPVHYSAPEDVWVLTRFEDVYGAFRDSKTWSSQRRGNLLNDIPARIGKTLGTTDPPRHTFARRLVNKAFTPRTVAALEPKITGLAQELTQAALSKGEIEFVADISAPYNAAILGAMFGIPEADFITLRHWLDDFFLRVPVPEGQEAPQTIAMRYLREYLDVLAKERAADPGNDLMTAMLLAEEDGQRLEQEQVVVTTMTFLTAGFESTNNLFTNLAYALALHPHVLAELKQNPDLMANFVEEGMRWDAAAQGFVRTPTSDVRLHDVTIPENSQVLLHIGAANRDEREFSNPDTFDLHREHNNHLGLGGGIHFCVGAPLGRLMTQTIFTALIASSQTWQVDLSSAKRVTTPNFRGFARLPLTIAR